MKRSTRRIALSLAVAALAAALPATAAAQVNAHSGKSKMTFIKREMVAIPDAEGHVIAVSETKGVNENTGKWEFLNGAETSSRSLVDLVKGNGTQSGYFVMSKDGSTAVSKYTGTVRTVLSPEGKPVTTYSGEWKWLKCTGALDGCTGQGTYQATSISETELLVEYRGIIAQ